MKNLLFLFLSLFVCSPISAQNSDNFTPKRIYLGIYNSVNQFKGYVEPRPEIFYFPAKYLEFRGAVGYGVYKEELNKREYIEANGAFAKAGFGLNLFIPNGDKIRTDRIRFGFEYSVGTVRTLTKYTFQGIVYEDLLLKRIKISEYGVFGPYLSVLKEFPRNWYLDLCLRATTKSILGTNGEDFKYHLYIPGAGFQEQYLDFGIHIGKIIR
jgi:hypothetical protein